jgi:hypothetical protein
MIYVLEVYFNIYETPERTTQILRNIEGFDNEKVREVLVDKKTNLIKRIRKIDELKDYFWAYKKAKFNSTKTN